MMWYFFILGVEVGVQQLEVFYVIIEELWVFMYICMLLVLELVFVLNGINFKILFFYEIIKIFYIKS